MKEEFSKRAEQIRRELGEKEATQKQKDKAAVSSRQAKPEHIDRDKLPPNGERLVSGTDLPPSAVD